MPVLARTVRARIEAMLPANLGRLAPLCRRLPRRRSRRRGRPVPARRRFWERFFDGPVAASVLAGDERRAREQMLALINRRDDAAAEGGIVYLVGAGPGDPELLTLKALRLLQEADVIVHDRLVGPRLLDYARRDAERIYVGKARGAPRRSARTEINALLVRSGARRPPRRPPQGRRSVRLRPRRRGAGPSCCATASASRWCPGITAALGCAAAAGIPLTQRDHAQALTVVTAQGEDGEDPELDWRALARDRQTLAIYMGASAAGRIAGSLIAARPRSGDAGGGDRQRHACRSAASRSVALHELAGTGRRSRQRPGADPDRRGGAPGRCLGRPARGAASAAARGRELALEAPAMSEPKATVSARPRRRSVISAARGSRGGTALKAVTANRLADGAVVYLAADGGWVEAFGARADRRRQG